ncbi:terminase large subunit domain-containing protein [Vreelandella maris]|uniref:terminase large subunit domain-containing protein n=1 Tax=Vreelandella maris TaxID=2729617 RepID=UPI0030EDACE3
MSEDASLDVKLHKRQGEAFDSIATEILYGGAAGGGKSHLMRVAAVIWCAEIPGLMVYIFRRLSDDLEKNHLYGPGGFFEMLSPWLKTGWAKYNGSKHYIEFWNGSRIFLAHCQHEKDKFKYQGAEIHVLLVDELTHFTESIYRYLRGRLRLGALEVPEKYKGMLPRAIAGTNPGGVGHNWVKHSFVDAAKPMEMHKTAKPEGGMLRQYIPARLDDNPTLLNNDPDYIDRLEGLGNPALVKAMKDGDWNIVSGGAFDDVWNANRHVTPRFKVPSTWYVDRGFDWGSSHPFSVLWFAESDGSEVELEDGSVFCPPKGSIVVCHEWYGAKGPNEGLKLSAPEIAKGIKERESSLINGEWLPANIKPGPADNQISNVNESGSDSVAKKMEAEGVRWTESDKKPGSRVNGLEMIRTRLKEAAKDQPESPGLYFMDHCIKIIAHLPVLPRDQRNPDDIDTTAEDHDYDTLRYRVMNKRAKAGMKRIGGLG